MPGFKKEFKLTKKALAKEKAENKKLLMWKDVIENEMPEIMEPISTASETG